LVRGEYDKALVHINIVIHSNPDFGEAYNCRGLVYHAKGNYDGAIQDFSRAIELSPDPSGAYSNRGITHSATGEHDRAIADFDRAIQLEDDFAKAYYNRGLAHLAQGKCDAAIADFDRAIDLTPENDYLVPWNLTPVPTGDLVMSVLDQLRLYQSEADLPLVYASRGLAHLTMGDLDQATADIKKAQELGLDLNVWPQAESLPAEWR
jgi:tetratricopeptide (TPR) repeat protein